MRIPTLALIVAAFAAAPPASAKAPEIPQVAAPSFADLADLATAAPVVAGVVVRNAIRLKGEAGAGAPAGWARFYVEAEVETLIRGEGGLPGAVRYLVDLPPLAPNRWPKLRKARALLLADTVAGRAGELRLVAPHAQLPWTAETEARLRGILLAMTAADAPPRVTGVGKAFHVPGVLPGESETQIFLTTADARPVSLSVLRRPGETPRWAVALGELVDEAAEPPARDTVLWYALACALPRELPAASTADLDPAAAAGARADYRLVIEGLGPCTRNYAAR